MSFGDHNFFFKIWKFHNILFRILTVFKVVRNYVKVTSSILKNPKKSYFKQNLGYFRKQFVNDLNQFKWYIYWITVRFIFLFVSVLFLLALEPHHLNISKMYLVWDHHQNNSYLNILCFQRLLIFSSLDKTCITKIFHIPNNFLCFSLHFKI